MNPEREHPGPYAVYSAVDRGDEEELRRLRKTHLHYAAEDGHVAAMQFLIDDGADMNAGGRGIGTPLQYAAMRDHVAAMQLLIDSGADMNLGNMYRETPLHHTAQRGHVEAMKLLIDNGADMNAKNGIGETPLHHAITHYAITQFECVRVLVLAGADMSPGYHNKSPLHIAVEKGDKVVAGFLIMHGCDTDLLDYKDRTALQLCKTTEMTETLQDAIREVRLSAVMMGHHERLGERSPILRMPPDLLREMFEKRY
jgi:ankyrin repeat protein